MATSIVKIISTDDLSQYLNKATSLRKQFAQGLTNLTNSIASGNSKAQMQCSYNEVSGVQASGTVTISSGSGAIAAVINGVTISITWATSDTNSATLLKNAINASADALVSGIVTATSLAGVVTITAVDKAKCGNSITLSATGTGATASGARLTGGVNPVFTSYLFS